MYRATAAYVLMLVLAGAGLWAILAMGSRLTAPADLAGVWTIAPYDAGGDGSLGRSFLFQQSGRFAMLCLDGHKPVSLTLQRQSHGNSASSVRLDFTGESASLTAFGSPGSDDFEFHLTGPITAQFHAHRTWRNYPPATGAPSTQP